MSRICKHCGKLQNSQAERRIPLGTSYVTPRERQIVAMYAEGATLPMVCKKLGIAKNTVDSLLRKARQRLALKTIYQLVAVYVASQPNGERGGSSNREPFTDTAPGTAPSRAL